MVGQKSVPAMAEPASPSTAALSMISGYGPARVKMVLITYSVGEQRRLR